MVRFSPSRTYLSAAAVALGLAVFSGWCATNWLPALVPALLFAASGALVSWLACRPVVEVEERGLRIGARRIAWREIRRVDQTGWISPLVLHLTLASGERVRLIYPGPVESSNLLLRLVQRNSTGALLNGVPYRQIWGEPAAAQPRGAAKPRYRLLTEADEAEVERLYHKLKAAGRLDPEK
jgi:hypothetical protein